MSHLGRPKGGPGAEVFAQARGRSAVANCSASPVQVRRRLHRPRGRETWPVAALKDGEVLLLENLRFHKEEEKNDPNFAKQLAKLGDVYVNDAFGTAHREHASTFGVPQALAGKPRVIGFLIQKELKFLGEAVSNPNRPFVAILGGAKVSDKINVIEQLLGKADTLLIGGAMAYTFFLAQGKEVGKSLVERDKVELAKSLLAKAGGKIKLPVDNVISDKMTDDAMTQHRRRQHPRRHGRLRHRPQDARARTRREIAKAKTIVWNGPMGVFEKKPFAAGTKAVAEAVAEATAKNGAITIIGGGDSAAAIEQMGLADKVSHVSTGGGASAWNSWRTGTFLDAGYTRLRPNQLPNANDRSPKQGLVLPCAVPGASFVRRFIFVSVIRFGLILLVSYSGFSPTPLARSRHGN